MAELTYVELTQGRESTCLPHTQINVIDKKVVFGPKSPVTQDACFNNLHKILISFCHYKV